MLDTVTRPQNGQVWVETDSDAVMPGHLAVHFDASRVRADCDIKTANIYKLSPPRHKAALLATRFGWERFSSMSK